MECLWNPYEVPTILSRTWSQIPVPSIFEQNRHVLTMYDATSLYMRDAHKPSHLSQALGSVGSTAANVMVAERLARSPGTRRHRRLSIIIGSTYPCVCLRTRRALVVRVPAEPLLSYAVGHVSASAPARHAA